MHTIFQCMFALVAHVSSANMQRPEESVEVVRAGVLRQNGHRPEGDMVDVWEVLQCADNTVGLPFCQIPGTSCGMGMQRRRRREKSSALVPDSGAVVTSVARDRRSASIHQFAFVLTGPMLLFSYL